MELHLKLGQEVEAGERALDVEVQHAHFYEVSKSKHCQAVLHIWVDCAGGVHDANVYCKAPKVAAADGTKCL